MRLLLRASRRYYLRHPWQLGLAITGIALGVAVLVAVQIASESAQRAFRLSMDEVTGTATHRIVGTGAGLDEGLYTSLRLAGYRSIAPVVETWGRAGDETLHVLGIDPFAESGFRGHLTDVRGDDSGTLMAQAATAYLAAPTARRLGIGIGDTLGLSIGGRGHDVRVIGLLEGDEEAAIEGLLVADIATAQELAGSAGRLGWIDVRAPADDDAWLDALTARLPPSAGIVPAESRSRALSEMSRAFHTNLTAMSLLALLVGMFLIYNTMSFAVVQRRAHIACARLVGATRGEVLAAVLVEALAIGAAATTLGLLAGVVLAEGLLTLVTRTLNDLYFTLTVGEARIPGTALLAGAALGMFGTLSAAFAPAREASTISPRAGLARSSIEARSRAAMPRLALTGIATLLVALAVLAASQRSLLAGFVGIFLVILGVTFLSPMVTVAISRLADRALASTVGVPARLAIRGIADSLSRTGVALAALMLAVATVIGVGLMISSFRAAVAEWLESALQADIFVTARTADPGDATLDPALVARLVALPEVAGHSLGRTVHIESGAGLTEVFVLGLSPGLVPQYPLIDGDASAIWGRFARGEAIVVSEPFAWHRGIAAGDELEVRTDRGPATFRVAGVFRDYTTGNGRVLMPRVLYERWFDDRAIAGLGLYLMPGADLGYALTTVRAAAAGANGAPVEARSNQALRALSMEVFDRTFTITEVLRLLAVAVAVIGIVSALMALQLERAAELGALRAIGLTPGNVFAMVSMQTACMGAIAGLIALPTGWLLAQILIHVINVRSFGWSMPALAPPEVLAGGFLLAVGSSVAAGLYPAWRMSRTSPAAALRNE